MNDINENKYITLNKTPIQNRGGDSNINIAEYNNSKSATKIHFTPKKLLNEYSQLSKANHKIQMQSPYFLNGKAGIFSILKFSVEFKMFYRLL